MATVVFCIGLVLRQKGLLQNLSMQLQHIWLFKHFCALTLAFYLGNGAEYCFESTVSEERTR